jgi:cytohesin
MARWLLDHGADPNWLGYIGASPLAWAEFADAPDLCRLLRDRGACEDIRDREFKATPKEFPIMVLSGWGFRQALIDRLRADPSLTRVRTRAGTPLHVAAKNGHAVSVQILLAAGAETGAKDDAGKTPLDLARDKGHTAAVALLEAAEQKP